MLVIPDFLMQKLAEFANTTQTEVALVSTYRGIRTQVTVFPTEYMEEHLVLDATPPAKLEELLTNLSADLRERVTLYYTVTSRRENEDSFYCSDAVKSYLSVSLLQEQPRSQLEQSKYQSTETDKLRQELMALAKATQEDVILLTQEGSLNIEIRVSPKNFDIKDVQCMVIPSESLLSELNKHACSVGTEVSLSYKTRTEPIANCPVCERIIYSRPSN